MRLQIYLFYLLLTAPIAVIAQITDTTAQDTSSVVIFSLSADNLESASQNQDISPLLQSTRDVFASIAGFNFSNARYQIRGLESDQYIVMMNNVPMNDPELGWNVFAFWGGLNDVTRYPESQFGLGASPTTFSGPGGYSNISLRSSEDSKGSRFSYASTNRIYRNRVMFTHSTGVMENGWSLTASGSYRWSEEGYVPGTYFSGGSYFLSLEKKVNANHSIGFAGFGAPTLQGRAGIAIQEAYDLTGTNYYNPYWGYQTDGVSGER
ncbi:MAG: TonB-dependent receptor plug domain-containing protein, partial [Flavobacteriales bacterium]